MRNKYLLDVFSVILLQIRICTAVKCLSCADVIQPRHCHYLTDCSQGEICFTEQFQTSSGQVLFNVGCKSKSVCDTDISPVTKIRRENDKKADDNHHSSNSEMVRVPNTRSGDRVTQILCQQCCDGELCNANGCGETGYPISRGPICFNCPQTSNQLTCDAITVCDQNEKCFIESDMEFGDVIYKTHCLRKDLCDMGNQAPVLIGKRNTPGTCRSCCYTDLCNNQCGHSSSTTTGQTTVPATHSTTTMTSQSSTMTTSSGPQFPQGCFDQIPNCDYYITKNGNCHRLDNDIKQRCGKTCGICGSGGTEYLIMFLENYANTNNIVTVIITSETANASVTVEWSTGTINETLKGHSIEIDIPTSLISKGMKVEKKGIIVRSSSLIFVYGFNRFLNEAVDGFSAIPISKFASRYTAVTYHPRHSRGSVIGITAPYDKTFVTITMNTTKAIRFNGTSYGNGDSLQITLNRMETFQVQQNVDLTGTIVSSSRPVAVLSGNRCSDIPGFCNHLVEFLPYSFGKEYILPPLRAVEDMIVRIVPDYYPSTDLTVTINSENNVFRTVNVTSHTLEFSLSAVLAYAIQCSKPCLVVQYAKYDGTLPPFMTVIPSIDQFSNRYVLRKPSMVRNFTHDYALVFAEEKLKNGLEIEGRTVYSAAEKVSRTTLNSQAWIIYRVPLVPGTNRIYHTDVNVKFGLTTYGYKESSDAYGFPAFININK